MKLLVQSSHSFQSHLAEISEILGQATDSPYQLINDNAAIYEIGEGLSGDLKNQLHLKHIDFAILDHYKALNEFSLCVMDMDSTLI